MHTQAEVAHLRPRETVLRLIVAIIVFTVASCSRLEKSTGRITPEHMLVRSTHVFIATIQKQEFQNTFLFRVSGEDARHWQVRDITVHVENALRGMEPRQVIDIYEAFPTGILSGDWNAIQNGRRYLFLVQLENGRYHVVQDFWRSIYPVYSGRHDRLPLDDSRPFWERFALLQWWVQPDRSPAFGNIMYTDPGRVFSRWRMAKVLRGLFHHPDGDVRLVACEDLLHMSSAQDECWDALAPKDRESLNRFRNAFPAESSWNENRIFERSARQKWAFFARGPASSPYDMDGLRLLTAINNLELRREFCKLFQQRFPQDSDNGCPAERPPPATIVTEDGDVPLSGAWPSQ